MSNWPSAPLGEIFRIARGGSPRPIQEFITDDPSGVNWIMIGDAEEGSKYITKTRNKITQAGVSRSRMVYPGEFLLTNSMSFGHPYILKTTGCIHDGWLVLSPATDQVHADYFYHLLGSQLVYAEFERRASGATVKNLNIELVKGVTVPVPPLAEQRRIAAILDQADALRAKRRQALAELNTLTQSIFLEMFGDPATNPKRWPVIRFGEVAECRLGKMLDQKRQTGQQARRYLRNANVQWFRFDLSDLYQMDFDADDRETFALKKGDLLICEGGEPGRAAVWKDEVPDCYYQKALHRARPFAKVACAEYLARLLWFLSTRGGLGDHVTAATIAHLTGEKLAILPVPLPPIELQRQFVDRLQRIEDVADYERLHSSSLEDMFDSVQQRAFRGEL